MINFKIIGIVVTFFSCLGEIHCLFATNFKCSESKQSSEYKIDVQNYVNEVSEYLNQQKMTNLDVSGVGVGFLSDEELSVGASYGNILSINLSMNVIKKISFSMAIRYPNLLHMDLSQNCLTSLDIQHRIAFKKLSSLNISRNSITHIHPFVFSNLSSLDTVDLSHNHLLRFLAADFEIKRLHINDNRLTQVEIDSRHHKELKLLDASNNDLKIFQINVDLNNLVLSGNQLTAMDNEYFSIRNVYGTLDLSENHISDFNWKFITCTTNLNLARNHIAMFQIECPSSKHFQRVKRLNLDGNFMCNLFHRVPAMLKCLPNLKFISLMHNRLNKAEKIQLKTELTRHRVQSQIFDYDATPITPCYADDEDCIAINLFHRLSHK